MKHTQITKEDIEERDMACVPEKRIDLRRGANDITYFSMQLLGVRPQVFQHLIYRKIRRGAKRLVVCSSRQIGKTTALAILAIHSAYYNTYSSGRTLLDTNAKIVIISKDDEASKRLMSEIRSMLISGDAHMNEITGGRIKNWFTRYVSQERKDPDNKRQLTFVPRKGTTRGSYIHCFPPTDAVTGNPVDLLILDEARFVEDEIYNVSIKPTVATTGGTIILSSTPGGQKGFYFEIFDPFDKHEHHEYTRLWFPWTVCELEGQRERVALEKKTAEKMGTIKTFRQEYEADFTVDESSFFELDKVDSGVDDVMVVEYGYDKTPSALSIDYGMTSCHTVVTITTQLENGIIRLLWQKEFPLGFDDNLLMDDSLEDSIPNLMKRFVIKWIIPDECAQGFRTNKEMVSKGFPVLSNGGKEIGWNFRSDQADRNKGYVSFRSKLHQGLIKYPKISDLIVQMKALQSIDNKIYTSIRKPQGGKDDRIDSFMMSCVPWTVLDDGGDFESELVVPDRSVLEIRDRWVDKDEFEPKNDAEKEEWELWKEMERHLSVL